MDLDKLKNEFIDWFPNVDPTLSTRLKTEFSRWNKNTLYNPTQIEKLIQDLGDSLDRMVQLKREFAELNNTAITRALEYRLFKQNKEIIKSLEIENKKKQSLLLKIHESEKISEQFDSSDHPLSKGFSSEHQANIALSEKEINSWEVRKEKIETKWKHIEEHQKSLEQRHSLPGGSMNFKERSEITIKYILNDFRIAISKALALEMGLRILYGFQGTSILTLDTQDSDAVDLIDSLSFWYQDQLENFEIEVQDYVETEITLSYVRTTGASRDNLIAIFRDKSKSLGFDLDKGLAGLNWKNAIVKGIGASFAILDTNFYQNMPGEVKPVQNTVGIGGVAVDIFGRRNHAFLKARIQPSTNSFDGMRKIPQLLVDGIGTTNPHSGPRFVRGQNIENLKPKGIWKVDLDDKVFDASDTIMPLTAVMRNTDNNVSNPYTRVTDVRLHLLLSTKA